MDSANRVPPWWARTTVYQIYVRSFVDSNGDGIGDLPGIISKLDWLHDLGVETLWLCPFYRSPQQDFGYDIADYRSVAPEYGSIDDVRRLVDEAHRRGLRVVADMVLNHTSIEHPWFQQSRQDRSNPKRDWYIWRPGRKPFGKAPPNNWRSLVGPRGWHWDERTEQWYWASFLPFQPDLNYRNPEVQEAMLDVVRHWLAFGFDGLRLDIFHALFKDEHFQDNPFTFRPLPSEENPDGFFQSYRRTLHHPDTLAFARKLRRVVDEFANPARFMVGEVFGEPETLRQYCGDGLHTVFLFKSMRTDFTASAMRSLIDEFEREMPAPLVPTWVFGNHDRSRRGERLHNDPRREKLCAALQLTARGIPFIYYGEEIGMRDLDLPLSSAKDALAHMYDFVPDVLARKLRRSGILLNRDACRTPMQWSAEPNGGFCPANAQPWLPMHPLTTVINVASEKNDPHSVLACYHRFLAARKAHPALQAGSLSLITESELPKDVLGYCRRYEIPEEPHDEVQLLLNFGDEPARVEMASEHWIPIVSTYAEPPVMNERFVVLRPIEGVVFVRK